MFDWAKSTACACLSPVCKSVADMCHCYFFTGRRAKDLIQSNIDILHKTAAVLMEKENIDGDEFQQIVLESQAKQYLKQDAPGVTIPYQA